MAEKIPQATRRVRAEEGDLGGRGAANEIFDVLLGHWPEAEAEAVRTPVAANSTPGTR